MTKAFKASRLIGLLALLAGFMAFGAAAAQAEPGAYWEVGGTKIEGTSTLLPKINARKDTPHGTLLTKVGLSKVEILCEEIKFVNGLLHVLGRATGKIHFEKCETLLNGKAADACLPHSPTHSLGLIETNKLDGLLKLHSHEGALEKEKDLFELLPETGETFVTLTLGVEGKNECSIGEKIPINGKLFLMDCNNQGLVNLKEHLFEEQKTLSKLLFGGNPATIDGSAWAFLEGAHEGQLWSGHPA